jgi:hypothetical protein
MTQTLYAYMNGKKNLVISNELCGYKVLLNKDHAMCGKERFIGPDQRAITLGFKVRRLG